MRVIADVRLADVIGLWHPLPIGPHEAGPHFAEPDATHDAEHCADDVCQWDWEHLGRGAVDKQRCARDKLEADLGPEPDEHGTAHQRPVPIAIRQVRAEDGHGQQGKRGRVDAGKPPVRRDVGEPSPDGKRDQHARQGDAGQERLPVGSFAKKAQHQ